MPDTQTVFISDWIVETRIGLYDFEKNAPQRLRLNLVFHPHQGAKVSGIADTIDYGAHKKAISTLLAGGHIDLLETLADKIATLCLQDKNVARLFLKIEKLDIYADCSCGITLERGR